jgi:hypothetical protein
MAISLILSSHTKTKVYATSSNTISGIVTDIDGNPMTGLTIGLTNGVTPVVTSTTDSNGSYSITRLADKYALYVIGSSSSHGLYSFSLNQSLSNRGVDLNYGDIIQNLTIPTTTLSVDVFNNAGLLMSGLPATTVSANTTLGSTVLYPGDTGMSMNIQSTGFSTYSGSSGTIGTIKGALYNGSGLEVTSASNSICRVAVYTPTTYYDCLTTQLNVLGTVAIGVPSTLPVTRTFQGILKDSSGTPIPNVAVYLLRDNDTSPRSVTDTNGFFKLTVVPKTYSLKLEGTLNSGPSFTLAQSTTSPSINLLSSSTSEDLQLNSVTITVYSNDSSGNPLYFTTVNAKPSGGTTYLYSGDPGFAITAGSVGFSVSGSSNSGTINAIVGSTFLALGLGVSNPAGSICNYQSATSKWNCLRTGFTVTAAASVNTPY